MEFVFRTIIFMLDNALGWCIRNLYSLIVKIAHVDVFGSYIFEFMDRVYTFLAIFMIFKLSISMVNYILNPDQFTDKSRGYGKLIQNVIIVILLIITVPMIFDWAYKLQSLILNTNVLFTIVTGRKNDSTFSLEDYINSGNDEEACEMIEDQADTAGYMLGYSVFSTFIYKNPGENKPEPKTESERSAVSGDTTCYDIAKSGSNFSYKKAYNCVLSYDTVTAKTGVLGFGQFKNEYRILISTLCGGFVAYVLLVFCFDTALRSVRLGVLQLIAPIPIISMLDPNSGKNGMFSKWLKDCSETYLSLFIRLLGIFFAVEIIQQVTKDGINGISYFGIENCNVGIFVKLFIILGVLMFAKQLPSFIKNITGVSMEPGGLNLKKKVGDIPLAGKPMLAGAGLLGRSAKSLGGMGLRYAGKGLKAAGHGIDNNVFGGRIGAAGHWASTNINAVKNAAAARRNAFFAAHPNLDAGLNDLRTTFAGIGSDAQGTLYGVTGGLFGGGAAEQLDKQVAAYDQFLKQQSSLDSYVEGEIMKRKGRTATHFTWTNTAGVTMSSTGNVNVLKQQIESLKSSGASAIDIENAERAYNAALSQAKMDFIDDHKTDDVTVRNTISEMNYTIKSNQMYDGFSGMGEITTGAAWDAAKKPIKTAKGDLMASDKYRNAQARKAAMPKK